MYWGVQWTETLLAWLLLLHRWTPKRSVFRIHLQQDKRYTIIHQNFERDIGGREDVISKTNWKMSFSRFCKSWNLLSCLPITVEIFCLLRLGFLPIVDLYFFMSTTLLIVINHTVFDSFVIIRQKILRIPKYSSTLIPEKIISRKGSTKVSQN